MDTFTRFWPVVGREYVPLFGSLPKIDRSFHFGGIPRSPLVPTAVKIQSCAKKQVLQARSRGACRAAASCAAARHHIYLVRIYPSILPYITPKKKVGPGRTRCPSRWRTTPNFPCLMRGRCYIPACQGGLTSTRNTAVLCGCSRETKQGTCVVASIIHIYV